MNIDWNFVIGGTLLIVNSIVGVADWLQDGPMWPCLVIAIGVQTATLIMSRE